jgi:hypothetical protein
LSARLSGRAKLESHASGAVTAFAGDHAVHLGTFSQAAWSAVRELATGLPLTSLSPEGEGTAREIDVLVRRWRASDLWNAGTAAQERQDLLVIEPGLQAIGPDGRAGRCRLGHPLAFAYAAASAKCAESLAEYLVLYPRSESAGFVAMLSAPRQASCASRMGFQAWTSLAC